MKMFTVSEIIEAYEFDIEMLRADKKNSNRSKLIQRDKMMLQFLATLPEDMKISDNTKKGNSVGKSTLIHTSNASLQATAEDCGIATRHSINPRADMGFNMADIYNTPLF